MRKLTYNKPIETLVLLSADIYENVYDIVDGGYDVAVQALIDATNRFEKKWENELSKDENNDFIHCLEDFEEEELMRLRLEYGCPNIMDKFNEFKKKFGREPTYVNAQIMWKDNKETAEMKFKLDDGYDPEDDDEVFFSCHGIESFIEMEKDKSFEGGEDFIITQVFDFE